MLRLAIGWRVRDKSWRWVHVFSRHWLAGLRKSQPQPVPTASIYSASPGVRCAPEVMGKVRYKFTTGTTRYDGNRAHTDA